jgi:MFS family permease
LRLWLVQPVTERADLVAARQPALVPALFFVAVVAALVSSLGAPLVPTVATSYGVSVDSAQWTLTITLLAGAVATPTLGRLGDGPHRRRVTMLALTSVFIGSVLAALPFGFAWILVGRALQGPALALTPLVIATARDHIAPERARGVIGGLAVTTISGVGIGYPVTGLLADHLGLHVAFGFGVVVSGCALVCAFVVLPRSGQLAARRLDWTTAVTLASGLVALLLVISKAGRWGWTSTPTLLLSATAVVLLMSWVRREMRAALPLVNLRTLRHGLVRTADLTGFLAGVGTYLPVSFVTRLVQTPTSAGYGFGASAFVAGLILLPFSLFSMAGNRLMLVVGRRWRPDTAIPLGGMIFCVSMLALEFMPSSLAGVFVVIAFCGLGAGVVIAAMPGLIVRAVPGAETASALGFNQLLRTAGFSIGSALSAAILAAHTVPGSPLPRESGYKVATLVSAGLWLVVGAVGIASMRGHRSQRPSDDSGAPVSQPRAARG